MWPKGAHGQIVEGGSKQRMRGPAKKSRGKGKSGQFSTGKMPAHPFVGPTASRLSGAATAAMARVLGAGIEAAGG